MSSEVNPEILMNRARHALIQCRLKFSEAEGKFLVGGRALNPHEVLDLKLKNRLTSWDIREYVRNRPEGPKG